VFDEIAIAIGDSFNVTGRTPERIEGTRVSSSLLPMLGAKPLLERVFMPDEDRPGKTPSVVLSFGLWKRMFGAGPNVIGKPISLDRKSHTIVGVLPASFLLNREAMPTVAGNERSDIFLPLPMSDAELHNRGSENYNIMACLKPGVSPTQAQAAIDVIAAHIREQDRRDPTFTISVVPLLDERWWETSSARWLFFWARSPGCCSSRAPMWQTCCSHGPRRVKKNSLYERLWALEGRACCASSLPKACCWAFSAGWAACSSDCGACTCCA